MFTVGRVVARERSMSDCNTEGAAAQTWRLGDGNMLGACPLLGCCCQAGDAPRGAGEGTSAQLPCACVRP